MKITLEIKRAIQHAIDDACNGVQSDFAKRVGIVAPNITRYLSGETKSIDDENWDKLRPAIIAYMEHDDNLQKFSPDLQRIIDIVQDWDELWQSKAKQAILELEAQKKAGAAESDLGECKVG